MHRAGGGEWKAIVDECTGKVASLIELLQGQLSKAVMEVVTRQGTGLFPLPRQIGFRCSCPDAASMCKHVAAVLYGVGARLDNEPELLFRLRQVEPHDLIRQVGDLPAMAAPAEGRLERTDLSALFGIDLDDAASTPAPAEPPPRTMAAGKAVKPSQSGEPSAGRRPGARKAAGAVPSTSPAVTAAAKKKKPGAQKERGRTLKAAELIARGIPRHMIQAWLNSGVLLATTLRGAYRTTQQTEARIEAYLARGDRD